MYIIMYDKEKGVTLVFCEYVSVVLVYEAKCVVAYINKIISAVMMF